MDFTQFIQPGMQRQTSFHVGEQHTALHLGSGSMRVLASPIMIAYMERAARDLLDEQLPEGYSSVGVHVNVRHLAPSPLGSLITVDCEILAVNGRQVDFSVQAQDNQEKIGEGHHQRVIIDLERFLSRVQAKQSAL